MVILESIRIALSALWSNKLRAGLTMLGVIIGVTSVVVMVAIVQGFRQNFLDQFSSSGATMVFAVYQPKPDTIQRGGFSGLSMADVQAVRDRCTLISAVSPQAQTQVVAQVGRQRKSVALKGVLEDFPDTDNVTLSAGRFINADDTGSWGKGCVLGSKLKRDLFGDGNAVGKTVLCSENDTQVALTVIGVLKEKDRNGGGDDYNNSIYAALTSVQKRFTGTDRVAAFTAKAVDIAQVNLAADQIWDVLRQRHPLNAQDFIVDTQAGMLKQIDTILSGIQLVLGGVGGLALLTGGIGIMNIMLVSVTERTREIGIRKAVGATRGVILLQFIVEAMVVSGLGGLLGVGAGYGLAHMIDSMNKATHHGLPAFVPLWAAEMGFAFAVGVGLFFGIYPAYRAAKLDPITALRYE